MTILPYFEIATLAPLATELTPSQIRYQSYAAGVEPDEECHLELTWCLHAIFDGRYAHQLLCLGLRTLNPMVYIGGTPGSTDCEQPMLSHDALDRLAGYCDRCLGLDDQSQLFNAFINRLTGQPATTHLRPVAGSKVAA
ncbi:hypothetical protein [Hymenobacter siberiensis]|uniref:hypothetical protein n=1 Tax=Hymenobacter siberiensis TaxID=2848396 RepID=UPI001C1DF44A|nr:hypothetical protein [Hymenobacter siberiensis]